MVSVDEVDLEDKLSDLTFDAVAEPPRQEVIKNIKKGINTESISQNEPNNEHLFDEKYNVQNKVKKKTLLKKKDDPKKKVSQAGSSKIYGNVINVSNSSHVQVGPTTVYNFGVNKSQEVKTNVNIQITKEIEQMFSNGNKLTNNELDCISSHVGENWKDLGRKLDYSDGQLEQFYLNFHGMKIKEVIYQMLLDWTRVNPKRATIGQISSVLWDCNMKETVLKLATAVNLENNL